MTLDVCAGVAAGYEALKDAKIPLVREKIITSSGTLKEDGFFRRNAKDTGIIYACGFQHLNLYIEVSSM